MNIEVNPNELIQIFALSIIAFGLAMIFTPLLSHFLYRFKVWKKVKRVGMGGKKIPVFYKLHKKKHRRHIPTMAGVLIWGVVLIVTLILNFTRSQTYLPLFALVAVGALGLVDDAINVWGKTKLRGMRAFLKTGWLFVIAALGSWWFFSKLGWSMIHVPGVGDFEIGWLYIPLFILVIISTANAVNITDGLDGLAGGLLISSFGAFGIIAFARGQVSLAAFCMTICGVLLAFTWFNIYPARFFMGDTGSLALGATLGVIAMLTNSVLILPIVGFVFVIETLSVIIQLISKKLRKGKKVFLSSPLHHHFEAIGWPETKVTMRFWVIGVVMAAIGLILGLIGMGTA
ncbi:phospho-N-acetylmuramoyl-pentapeptide-transferase [Patescibacteria group bacterium]|nr:MAG: phospho-N-acetylmuramoyl-pentapeptide-transferase [Patescibacteria group bacterium]